MTASPAFRILVVDENPSVRLFVDLAVGSDDIRVAGAADGHAALDSVERERPDLVLAAAGLTGLAGHDLAHKLSERNLPVVLMTSRLDPARPAAGMIAKPLQVQQLRDLVTRMANGQSYFPASPEQYVPDAPVERAPTSAAPTTVDPIEAWMDGADSALGLVPGRWRRLADRGEALHSFTRDIAAFRAKRLD